MTTQDQAVRAIIDEAIVATHEGMLISDIIAGVLADMPRLMQASGANLRTTRVKNIDYGQWATEWMEIPAELAEVDSE